MLSKKINRNIISRLAVTFSVVGLITILAALIAHVAPRATMANATTPNGESSLSIVTDGGASVVLTVNSADGTFASSDAAGNNTARFSVSTTNYTGYTLSLSPSEAGENANKLTQTIVKNGISTTYAIDSIADTVASGAFDARYNNMWGIKPSKYNSAANADYLPAPTSAAVLDSTTAGSANEYTLDLGIRADYSKPAGAYSNTFVLVATANPTTYLTPVTLSAGVKSVTFSTDGTQIASLTESGNILLTYGVDYTIAVELADGYELSDISVTGGTLNGNTYRIEPGHAGAITATASELSVAPTSVAEPAADSTTEPADPAPTNGD